MYVNGIVDRAINYSLSLVRVLSFYFQIKGLIIYDQFSYHETKMVIPIHSLDSGVGI